MNKNVSLIPLEENDREQFIIDNQKAFKYGATEEFGMRDNHVNSDGEIISRKTIERCINKNNSETYRIMLNEEKVGGVIISINKEKKRGELEILYVSPEFHSKGIGYTTWCLIEKMHPEIKIWETITPYFEKRNIHFYVNRCGFHITKFYNEYYKQKHDENEVTESEEEDEDGEGDFDMFYFEKIIE
ncbi:hypothetical protein BCR32DRAFT_329906 [Anaeromyces robustus]|uniref:N-acetyltransferase domain-containing protein n=1 Tax=Anaeromyces robustus TaxID=1754192 RepID=A0A1Y1WNY0_9FUNG|nr:hypothetical protein BCR32DRAFT_329906 [Anaeromyces robustus]|eukprot:ORX75202.1 hypothetical protein BCR32DRAFT_329906 [Anaeromyces robustus]